MPTRRRRDHGVAPDHVDDSNGLFLDVVDSVTKHRGVELRLLERAPRPIELRFALNGVEICGLSLIEYDWLELEIDVSEAQRTAPSHELEIYASRTWQPSLHDPNSSDQRHLSIAVCNVEIVS